MAVFSRRIITGLMLAIPVFLLLLWAFVNFYAVVISSVIALLVVVVAVFEYLSIIKGNTSILQRVCLGAFLLSGPIGGSGATWIVLSRVTRQSVGTDRISNRAVLVMESLLVATAVMVLVALCLSGVYLFKNRHESYNLWGYSSVKVDVLLASLFLGVGGSMFVVAPLIPEMLMWVLFSVCLSDIGAYYVGRRWGRIKLASSLSPKKTVEGALGGLVIGFVVAILVATILARSVDVPDLPFYGNWIHFIIVTVILLLGGQLGDLAESYIKRCYGVKDSSNILPGHGGIFDRLDSVFGALVVVAPLLILSYLKVG
jgi:CDP-diglyceride synthetase